MLQLELIGAELFSVQLLRVRVVRKRAKEEAVLWPVAAEPFLPHDFTLPSNLQIHIIF